MIRQAEISDLPEIVRMGVLFAASVGIPFDIETTLETAEKVMSSPDSVLLVDDGAMAAAVTYPLFLNKNIKIAQELLWWVDKDKRGTGVGHDILNALEEWAQSVGADKLTMMAMHDTSPDFIDQVYLRNGYQPFEKTFVKVL